MRLSPHRGPCVSAIAFLGAALALSSCTPGDAQPRLVLLYATCSLNKEFLAPYDRTVPYTPSLARFAEDSLVFMRQQTESGQSGVAFASIFSGAQATQHGVFSHPSRISDEALLITEAFASAGYDVHAYLNHPMASASLNYAQAVPESQTHSELLDGRSGAFREVLRRLGRDPEYKAFIVTDFTVTHQPYRGWEVQRFCQNYPEECRWRGDPGDFERYANLYQKNYMRLARDFRATLRRLGLSGSDVARLGEVARILYKADVAHLDSLFEGVLAAIDGEELRGESLIAFTSDHGEIHYRANSFFHWTHGYQLAPEVLSVPLILSGPGAGVSPGRYEAVTRSIDLLPTLAGLAGVSLDPIEGGGVDLAPAIRGESTPPELLAFSHTALFQEAFWQSKRDYRELAALFPEPLPELMWVAVRERDRFFKLRRLPGETWRTSLFDLASDSGETQDLYDPNDAQHLEMSKRLSAYKQALVEAAYESSDVVPKDRALELLRSLGYVE
jgi:arylsulfatase A-like enzyme